MATRIALQLRRLERGLGLDDEGAWNDADDVASMIAVLQYGGRIGLLTLDPIETQERDGRVTRWSFRARRHDGVWVRVDVGPGEAERLRETVPELPAAGQWRAALERYAAALDPVARLLFDLRRDGKPSRAWEEHWGERRAGLEAAWAASEDPMAMRALLDALGVGSVDIEQPPASGGLVEPSFGAGLANALRRAIPTPPRGSPRVSLPSAEEEALSALFRELLPHRFGNFLVDRGGGAFSCDWYRRVHVELVFAFLDPMTEQPLSVVSETCPVTLRDAPQTRNFLEGWRQSLASQAQIRGWRDSSTLSSELAPRVALLDQSGLSSAADFADASLCWADA